MSPMRIVRKVNGKTLTAVLVGGLMMFFLLLGYILVEDEREKDHIQINRVNSCVQTYDGIQKAFLPFKPDIARSKIRPKNPVDAERWDNWKAFENTLVGLKKNCTKQTGVEFNE